MIVQLLFAAISIWVISLHIKDGIYLISGLKEFKWFKKKVMDKKAKLIPHKNRNVISFSEHIHSKSL